MPVGEVFLAAFFSVLFERLTSRELWQFLQQEGLVSKIKKWERTLRMIEAVLADAEDKQLTNTAVKMWLDDLRDLAYDVEDILDEFATEALVRKLKIEEHNQKASSSKVRKILPVCFGNWSPRAIKFSRSMEFAVADVSGRLEELYKLREDFGLREIAGGITSSSTADIYLRPSTTCLPTEPAVYGRDQDKDKVIQMVKKEEHGGARFCVTVVVGMGGLGKTTLVREVYNDSRMKDFDPRAWVCVSENFDVLRISNAILGSMTSSSCDYKDLNVVQIKLKEVVAGKKFMLVLDDVWSNDYRLWEILKSPFMCATQGSKIIVTTRLVKVALMLNPREFYELNLLSDDDCWSLFMSHAFESNDISVHTDVRLIRDKVIENCKGLPLAAKTLGGLLRSKQSEKEWLDVLNSTLWKLSDETEVLQVLKLSYYHLPSNLKRCFAYCAILPKGYEFDEEMIVHMWMSDGLLQKANGSSLPEDLGNNYFHDLVLRSIFQKSSMNENKYALHDLVSDLAQWVSGETCLTLDAFGTNKQQSNLEKLRHCSYLCGVYDDKSKFEYLMSKAEQIKQVRTFVPLSRPIAGLSYIAHSVLYDLLPKFNKLRALSFKNYHITELPESIGHLRHLRYLNLSYTRIRYLPESTCSLINLQIIKLKNCFHLRELPSKISNLINLRHLNVKGTRLTSMPLGLKKLKFLQSLTNFVVGKGCGAEVKDLSHLKFLHGELCISRLQHVMYPQQLEEMILKDLKDVKVLQLEWGPKCAETNDAMEKHALDMLQPHQNLEELTIKCYNGIGFPLWLGNLCNMTVLRLESCEKCMSLPSLGRLGSLKELTIKGMKVLKCIGYELYGECCSKPFQLLQTLCFEDLQEWEVWEPTGGNKHVHVFPCLRKLSIVRCPKLSGHLPNDLSSLHKLAIRGCPELTVSLDSLPLLCELELDGCNKVVSDRRVDFKSLKSMTLSNISDYHQCFPQQFEKDVGLEKAPQLLQSFTLLRGLQIRNCSNLISLGEVCFLSNLTKLKITYCSSLASLPNGMEHNNPCLEELMIEGCDSLRFIIHGQPPPSLRRLNVRSCKKLEYVFDDEVESCTSSVLHAENADTCSSVADLRGQFPVANLRLHIEDCVQVTGISSTRKLPQRLYWLEISEAPSLESMAERFPDDINLEDIHLWNCENLKCIPEGLDKLSCLQRISVAICPKIVCFPEGGFPDTVSFVSISNCEQLEALPDDFHCLNSLTRLHIFRCSSINSFTVSSFPTNLTALAIVNNENMYKAVVKWGIHNLNSLTYLHIEGCQDAESFPQEELRMHLPPAITHLTIGGFPKLKYLSSKGFQTLTSLQRLSIADIPNLTCFPKQGLPSSLLRLHIYKCPLLKEACKRNTGREWFKISHIPFVGIDSRFIYDPEEED